MLSSVLFALLASFFVYRLANLIRNYLQARKIGLPIIIIPISWQDPPWIILFSKFAWIERLPFGSWYKYSYLGWVLHDRYSTHQTLGRAFTIVSPTKNEIVLAGSADVKEVMSKYKKWMRPRELYDIFTTLGQNVDSVDGDEWQKHRKIVNHGFKDSNNVVVWNSAMRQAEGWIAQLSKEINLKDLADNMDTISTNVLLSVGFGQNNDFGKGLRDIPKGHQRSFAAAMSYTMKNILVAFMAMKMNLPDWFEAKIFKEMTIAKRELGKYFDETLQTGRGDLVNALLAANETEKIGGRGYLTHEELHGNMFIIQLAGFDTTSYSMLFSLALLSIHPEIQEWARLPVEGYEKTFDKAVRIRAVMYETLRRYGAAPSLLRESPNTERVTLAGKDVVLPAGTFLSTNIPGVHHDPELWGKDTAVWRPERFIEIVDGKECLRRDPELIAWSAGPRICPGKKFSQVEFTAVIIKVLAEYRLEGSVGLQEALDDFEFRITPKVKKPEAASIRFVKI